MPTMQKEVTTNSDERRKRLRRRKLESKDPAQDLDSGSSGLHDGPLLAEAFQEGRHGALIHPSLDELERRFGWESAAKQLRNYGAEGGQIAESRWGGFLSSNGHTGSQSLGLLSPNTPALRERSSRVAQLKRRSPRTQRWSFEDIEKQLSGGEGIPDSLKERLEPALGLDLSGIRLHRGTEAARIADGLGALAFAAGSDIVFGSGAPDLNSQEGLFLLTHELAHVRQQAVGEAKSTGDTVLDDSALESQADGVAESVTKDPSLRLESQPVAELAGPELGPEGGWIQTPTKATSIQPYWGESLVNSASDLAGDAWDATTEVVGDVVEGVTEVAGDLTQKLWDMVAALGPKIPGYELLTVIIGKDPLSGQDVPRNATNLVKGVMSLVPGGVKLFQHLQASGALEKSFEWLDGEVTKLNITFDSMVALAKGAIESLGMGDLLDPSGAIAKLGAVFSNPLKRIATFAGNVGSKVMEFIMESVLAKAGPMGQQILGILKRAGGFISKILKDPIPFLNNLVKAVKAGLGNFSANAPEHLQKGFVGWLTGAGAKGGLKLPSVWNMAGILGFAADILGLTWQFFKPKLEKLIGPKRVAQLEQGFDVVKRIREEGISAVADLVLEAAGDIEGKVMGAIKDWAVTKVVKSAIIKLASMFNPAGALIQAVMGIYNTVAFFIERADQIKDLTNSILDSIDNIANGQVGAAAKHIENSIAKAIPVMMGFLSRFVGLGNIAKNIKTAISKVRVPIEKGIDKACDWIAKKAGPMLDKINADKPKVAMAGAGGAGGGQKAKGEVGLDGGKEASKEEDKSEMGQRAKSAARKGWMATQALTDGKLAVPNAVLNAARAADIGDSGHSVSMAIEYNSGKSWQVQASVKAKTDGRVGKAVHKSKGWVATKGSEKYLTLENQEAHHKTLSEQAKAKLQGVVDKETGDAASKYAVALKRVAPLKAELQQKIKVEGIQVEIDLEGKDGLKDGDIDYKLSISPNAFTDTKKLILEGELNHIDVAIYRALVSVAEGLLKDFKGIVSVHEKDPSKLGVEPEVQKDSKVMDILAQHFARYHVALTNVPNHPLDKSKSPILPNAFSFLGHRLFVDQYDGYSYPLSAVRDGWEQRKESPLKIFAPNTLNLASKYDYTKAKKEVATSYLEATNALKAGSVNSDYRAAMICAALIAETQRNPVNIAIINLLMLDGERESIFSGPMTKGKTAQHVEKGASPHANAGTKKRTRQKHKYEVSGELIKVYQDMAVLKGIEKNIPPTLVTKAEAQLVKDIFVQQKAELKAAQWASAIEAELGSVGTPDFDWMEEFKGKTQDEAFQTIKSDLLKLLA